MNGLQRPQLIDLETIESLRRKILEYERWFRFLDGQNRLLERERQKLSAVLNHTDAGFLVIEPSLQVVWASEVYTRYFKPDSNPDPVVGSPCHRAVCGREAVCDMCPAARTFQSSAVAHGEIRLVIDGKQLEVYVTAMPLKSPFGDTEEAMVMLQDVSELRVLRSSFNEPK